jgi:hypothetical protein
MGCAEYLAFAELPDLGTKSNLGFPVAERVGHPGLEACQNFAAGWAVEALWWMQLWGLPTEGGFGLSLQHLGLDPSSIE